MLSNKIIIFILIAQHLASNYKQWVFICLVFKFTYSCKMFRMEMPKYLGTVFTFAMAFIFFSCVRNMYILLYLL